jgi:hypothetical protein
MLVAMPMLSSIHGGQDVPEQVRARITLVEPAYLDVFTIETPVATDHSAEDWARAILERAPVSRRNARRFWRSLGLRLGPQGSPDHVQGWRIAAAGDDWLRIETASFYMTAEAVCLVEPGRVSLSLCVRHDRPPAALVWALIAGPHQRAVPVMLRQAVALMTEGT